jgi:hypothetical protein
MPPNKVFACAIRIGAQYDDDTPTEPRTQQDNSHSILEEFVVAAGNSIREVKRFPTIPPTTKGFQKCGIEFRDE